MMRVYELLPGQLYLSARTHQLTDAECTALVERYRLTGVLNLWHTPDPRIEALVAWYENEPIPDGQMNPNVALTVEVFADEVAERIAQGGCILLHCWGGRNRSGLVAALVLMRINKLTGVQALAAVKAIRKGALVNEHFVRYLEGQA